MAKADYREAALDNSEDAARPQPELIDADESLAEIVLLLSSAEAGRSPAPDTVSPSLYSLVYLLKGRISASETLLLWPFALRLANSETGRSGAELVVAYGIADWVVREVAPLALEAKQLDEKAELLRNLAEISNRASAGAAERVLAVISDTDWRPAQPPARQSQAIASGNYSASTCADLLDDAYLCVCSASEAATKNNPANSAADADRALIRAEEAGVDRTRLLGMILNLLDRLSPAPASFLIR